MLKTTPYTETKLIVDLTLNKISISSRDFEDQNVLQWKAQNKLLEIKDLYKSGETLYSHSFSFLCHTS
jgi:hypothetical protein